MLCMTYMLNLSAKAYIVFAKNYKKCNSIQLLYIQEGRLENGRTVFNYERFVGGGVSSGILYLPFKGSRSGLYRGKSGRSQTACRQCRVLPEGAAVGIEGSY